MWLCPGKGIHSGSTPSWIDAGATAGGGGLTALHEAGLLRLHGLQLGQPREEEEEEDHGRSAAARAEAEALWRAAAPTVRLGLALQRLVGDRFICSRDLPSLDGRGFD